jgi:hypothetical protein
VLHFRARLVSIPPLIRNLFLDNQARQPLPRHLNFFSQPTDPEETPSSSPSFLDAFPSPPRSLPIGSKIVSSPAFSFPPLSRTEKVPFGVAYREGRSVADNVDAMRDSDEDRADLP